MSRVALVLLVPLYGLVALVRRRPLVALVLGGVAYLMLRGHDTPRPAAAPQAAVRSDGFAVLDGDGSRRLVELDIEGGLRRTTDIRVTNESRVVGTRSGSAIVWRDGDKVKVAVVDSDGSLDKPQSFGKRAKRFCDGVASNDRRFAVGWVEGDGTVWFVHGPSGGRSEDLDASTTKGADYCAVASAGDQIGLLWQEADKVFLTLCRRDCKMAARIGMDKKRTILGFGCANDGCVLATRPPSGGVDLTWLTAKGKALWTKPLPGAGERTEVSLIGAGASSLAIVAYASGTAIVSRIASDGAISEKWHSAADSLPSLAWSEDLLVAFHKGGELATELVRFPGD